MIKGKKIYLCAVEEQSIEQLREWRNTPNLRQYFREYREINSTMQKDWFHNRVMKNKDQVDFEIRDQKTNTLLGHCGLYYINWISRKAEFTVYIGNKHYRSGGYGSDALRTLFKYGFEQLNLNKIWCEVYSNNQAINIYRHLGFVDEGCLRQNYYNDGKYWDSYLLGLLRDEWQKLNQD